MTLSEFVNKRLKDLGKNRNWLVNFCDLEWSTLSNIDKGLSIRKVTQEKLAKALECNQGDIQACLAETPNPLRKEAAKPEGTAGISIMAKPKKKPKQEAPAPDPKDEEPAEVFQTDEPEEKPFPVYHSVYEEDRQEGEERYKQKLRDMCLRIFSSGVPGTHTMKDIYADIGYALVKELAKGGDEK